MNTMSYRVRLMSRYDGIGFCDEARTKAEATERAKAWVGADPAHVALIERATDSLATDGTPLVRYDRDGGRIRRTTY